MIFLEKNHTMNRMILLFLLLLLSLLRLLVRACDTISENLDIANDGYESDQNLEIQDSYDKLLEISYLRYH